MAEQGDLWGHPLEPARQPPSQPHSTRCQVCGGPTAVLRPVCLKCAAEQWREAERGR